VSVTDLLSLYKAAPWLAVSVLCLFLSLWVYRQGRRAVTALEGKCARSARAQGERIGELEQEQELERTRRLQLEDELARRGVDLPWWPPDGNRPRPLPTAAPLREPFTAEAPFSPPVPPLSDDFTRHRR
jgi:hypothetical protein